MAKSDFLTRQRDQISARLEELRPLYEEYLTLEKAQQALDDLGEPVRRALGRAPGRPRGRRPGRPRGKRASAGRGRGGRGGGSRSGGSRSGSRGGSSRGGSRSGRNSAGSRSGATRGRRGGTRSDQALTAIRARPGITISELADELGIRPNYLYRVTAALHKERKIRRRGNAFHPA